MFENESYNELLSIKAIAGMLIEKADRLIEKECPVSTGTSKNKKIKKTVDNFLIKRNKTIARRGLRMQAQKSLINKK